MKRHHRLAIPQHEFGFSPDTFNLYLDTAMDGERIAREHAEAQKARKPACSLERSTPDELLSSPRWRPQCQTELCDLSREFFVVVTNVLVR